MRKKKTEDALTFEQMGEKKPVNQERKKTDRFFTAGDHTLVHPRDGTE
jgi:hypothetical protein